MILYKYVSANVAKCIFNNRAIAFSRMHTLNDPFEMQAIINYKNILNATALNFDDNIDESLLPHYINYSCGVLSLTRDPLNLIMWSHYADNHAGVVIGLDIEECGFCDDGENIIPAQLGDVVYSRNVPKIIDKTTCDPIFTLASNYKQIISEYGVAEWGLFKGAFLYKSYDWAYEEEVRVVKKISDNSDWDSVIISNDNNSFFDLNSTVNVFKIPISAIKEIYLGVRFPLDDVSEYIPVDVMNSATVKVCKIKCGEYALELHEY